MKENIPTPRDQFKETVDTVIAPAKEFLDGKPDLSRRQVLIGGGALLATGFVAGRIESDFERREKERIFEASERFTKSVEFYTTLYGKTRANQVLFFDAVGGALGDPLDMESVTLENGKVLPPEVPSKKIFELNEEWADAKRQEVGREFDLKPDTKKNFPGVTHTTSTLRLAKKGDPEFQGETVLDIVKHY
jgi:hypothetical protein